MEYGENNARLSGPFLTTTPLALFLFHLGPEKSGNLPSVTESLGRPLGLTATVKMVFREDTRWARILEAKVLFLKSWENYTFLCL